MPVRVAVIGGGYAGAAFAIHLSRLAPAPVDIVVIEPRDVIGGGLAHSTTDPDHRLNAPDITHFLYPDDDLHFRRWLEATGRLARDPDACRDGRFYPRRGDFGAYVAAQFDEHAVSNPSGSSLTHRRERVSALARAGGHLRMELTGGDTLEVDRSVIAIGQSARPLRLPGLSAEEAGGRVVVDPFAPGALADIDPRARVLVLGTGLTSADTVCSLLGRGHVGPITCISRRGQRPRDQNPTPSPVPMWEQLATRPAFIKQHGLPRDLLSAVRRVRGDVRVLQERGESWHGTIDAVRDAAGELWQALPVSERARFVRHVKPYYDSHRFRIPPQTGDILRDAESSGQLTFASARVTAAHASRDGIRVTLRGRGELTETTHSYGKIVSCAGLDAKVTHSRNPLVRSCLQGLARPSDMARGLDTDGACRVLAPDGAPVPGLFAVGLMTLDRFGEQPAVIFTLRQILSMLPGFVDTLGS